MDCSKMGNLNLFSFVLSFFECCRFAVKLSISFKKKFVALGRENIKNPTFYIFLFRSIKQTGLKVFPDLTALETSDILHTV